MKSLGKVQTYLAYLLSLSLVLSFSSVGIGQNPAIQDVWSESGLPYIRNFSPKEYGGFIQNWSVLQDQRGFIYVANNDGLLEYDGASWRLYGDEGKLRSLRSLAIDRSGVIYVGGAADFGYIVPDSLNAWKLVSLLPKVDKAYREFNDVWSTLVLGDAVYFMTPSYLFRWSKGQLRILHPKTRFHTAFVVGEHLYIRQPGVGLTRIVGDSLELIPGGDLFSDKRVYFMARRDDALLIGTDEHGFYLHNGATVSRYPTSAEDLLQESKLYCGIALDGGYYALGTRRRGLLIMDSADNIVQHLSTANGLSDDSVWFVHTDHQGGLWLALNNGLARVETPAAFTFFDKRNGLEGTAEKAYRHNNILYVATSVGMQYLDASKNNGVPEARFKPVTGIDDYCWTFLTVGDELFAGSTGGIHLIADSASTRMQSPWASVFSLTESKRYPGRIYVGHRNGVGILENTSGQWRASDGLANYTEKVYQVTEDTAGALWFETDISGVARAQLKDSDRSASGNITADIVHFDTSNGLPNDRVFPIMLGGAVRFMTPQGIWKFDAHSNRFLPDSIITQSGYWDFLGVVDTRGNLWLSHANRYGEPVQIGLGIPGEDGTYKWHPEPFRRLQDIAYVTNIYPEPNGAAWFSTSEGVIRYMPVLGRDARPRHGCFIRRVVVNEDSTIFSGSDVLVSPVLGYDANTILIEFAAPSFDASEETQYQHKLEGFIEEWSHWNPGTKKEYTNLSEGEYVFKVRAKNIYKQITHEASFSFFIQPPWYRSWWAYLLYILAFASVLFTFVRYEMARTARREQEKAKLREAKIIRKKNIELKEKNQELESVLQKLQSAQDSLIDSESRFRAVAESANDAIITSDINGQIIFWNKHAETIFGYSEEEAVGKPLTMLMPAKHHQAHREGLERFLTTSKSRIIGRVVELEAKGKDGTEFPIELTLAAWETHDTKFVSGIVRDITKRKQQQAELEKTQVQLFQSEKMASLGKLTAGIAHEINTPLAAIKSNTDVADRCITKLAEMLQTMETSTGVSDSDEYEKLVNLLKENNKVALNASDRIAQILKSLKNFARLDKAEFQRVDLRESIENTLALLEHEMDEQINLVREYDVIPPVECYPGEINQVFMNLLTNAVQAIKGKGTITIRTSSEDGHVHIQIADTGIGITSERMKTLFDPTFTATDSRVKAGLGLYTSQMLIQRHHGQIQVESDVGKGSTFTVILPKEQLT